MLSTFRNRPLHLVLLPLSFAAYALSLHFGRATVGDALLAAVDAFVGLSIGYGLLRLGLRRSGVAALLATAGGVLFLYWSYPYLRLRAWSGADARWTSLPVLLLGVVALLTLLGVTLYRMKEATRLRLQYFLNLLFAALTLYNMGVYSYRITTAKALLSDPPEIATGNPSVPLFLLLFDELGSVESLQQLGIATDGLDSFLHGRGFYVAEASRSNYPMTHFSVASALNECYLTYPSGTTVSFPDYNAAQVNIRHSRFVKSFEQSGYAFRNQSIFPVAGVPPFEGQTPLKDGLTALFSGTFWGKVLKPVVQQKLLPQTVREEWFSGKARTEALLHTIATEAQRQQPVLCYAHFFLPHTPYYFDAQGQPLPFDSSVVWSVGNNPRGYAGNVRSAVVAIKQAVGNIQAANPQAMILVFSDHGYRNEALSGNDTSQFRNRCAVYYPDRDYTGWRQDITLVNAFRLLHNKALGTALPQLPDSTVLLRDATGLDW